MEKPCCRENKEHTCCSFCCYNQDCSVSCLVTDNFNCDDCGVIITKRNIDFQCQLNLREGGGNV